MLISVILPCYNPPENWAGNIISEYRALTAIIKDPIEIILVEDGTNSKLNPGIELLRTSIPSFETIRYETNKGKGFAIRKGVEAANGEIIIYTDVDFPYATESLFKIYMSLREKETEIAIGVKDQSYYDHVPFARRVLSKGLRRLIRFFLSIPITDTQCGLKGFVKEIKPVFLTTSINRYLFDLEFIRLAHKRHHSVKPIEVELNKDVQFRPMNYKILLPEVFNFIKLLFKSN